ncbi:BQ2448_5986 [Microbotryum intermedium]|uniref:Dolichyl-phosphate-mannose--protein mannosyltransferase n=1 Tax=Microbotryum intermedium TaxID=269621 RepID=A0A238EZP6_9BASI|nr:BQ2448_5986 [Microbotryum intermedium]
MSYRSHPYTSTAAAAPPPPPSTTTTHNNSSYHRPLPSSSASSRPSQLHSHTTHRIRPESRSPSPTARDRDWIDVYSPHEQGLPIYTTAAHRNSKSNSHSSYSGHADYDSSMQVVDSSTARRRGGGAPYEGVNSHLSGDADAHDSDLGENDQFVNSYRSGSLSYDGDKGEKSIWPTSGIGIEAQVNETIAPSGKKEFYSATSKGSTEGQKWNKFIPERTPSSTWGGVFKEVMQELKPHIPLLIYTFLALFTRLYRIGANNTVVWDEAHFGKFGAYYLNRTFFFDVHPPLGKMLVGLAGALTGFNGSYDFPSGVSYPDHVPYTAMRVLLALPGVAMVPLAWGTALELRFSRWSTHIVTLMYQNYSGELISIITPGADLAWLVISRFILLDSMLIFFTFTTVYFLACFNNTQRRPFEEEWWFFLTMTGISIGCVASTPLLLSDAGSVKWVGLFVTALVGIYTAEDLWNKLGDLRMPYRTYVRHWVARVLCLILVPFCVYALTFKLHFLILNRSGSGDSQMSSLFQAHLAGNDFAQNPLEAAYGSKVTLKNMGFGGGLLHSHVQTYPVGSQQQQVTCYHYKDENNEFLITPTWEDPPLDESEPLRYLKDGDVIRLVHVATGRNLHSHPFVAPVSKLNNEVSCYGNATVGDVNDYWIVEVVDDLMQGSKNKVTRVHSLSTRLRLRHKNSGCYLRAANEILPQWGFKQVEVSCDKANNPKDEHTYWNIESHWNDRSHSFELLISAVPAGDQKLYRSPFFRDFWHLNVAMMTSNNALVPDQDKEDSIASSPFEWPYLWNGMRMNGWGDDSIKYYLVGNAVVWWLSTTSLFVFVGALFWHLMRFQRKINDFSPGEWNQFLYVGKIGFGGWVLHYIPFLIMGRVTYLHHYLPTLWFSVILFGGMLDHFVFKSRRLTQRTKWIVFVTIAGAVLFTFWWFHETAFGIEGPAAKLKYRAWRKVRLVLELFIWNLHD